MEPLELEHDTFADEIPRVLVIGLYAAGIALGAIAIVAAMQLNESSSPSASVADWLLQHQAPAVHSRENPESKNNGRLASQATAPTGSETLASATFNPSGAAQLVQPANGPGDRLYAATPPVGNGVDARNLVVPSAAVPIAPVPELACVPDVVIPFAVNSSMPHSAPAETAFATVAGWLQQRPEDHMIVEGHTDATGTADANLVLSFRRATAVKAELIRRGIRRDLMEVVALGDLRPIEGVPAASAENRRVVVRQKDGQACDANGRPMVTAR